MSRFAEASARAGRAVPENPRVDWSKERETAERLLSGAATEQAVPPPAPAVASPLAVDSVEQAFSWPPDFNLDEVDLSHDPHAREFRRPRRSTQRRVEVNDQTAPRRSQPHHESLASSLPSRPNVLLGQTAGASTRGTLRELIRTEARRVIPVWVAVAVGLIILLASVAFLTYVLRHRDVAAGPPDVHRLASAWLVPISVDMAVWSSDSQRAD
jgi:hypothetical protein